MSRLFSLLLVPFSPSKRLYGALLLILGIRLAAFVVENTLMRQQEPYLWIDDSRRQRLLPSFANGGVVVFFHVAKTGGTSIRENLQGLENVHFEFVADMHRLRELAMQADQLLTHQKHAETHHRANKKILFLETLWA